VVGLEDASRTSTGFLMQVIREAKELGIQRIRYADTVGIMYPDKIFNLITQIKQNIDISIEFHAHNDFGMAVANSVSAVMAGAEFVDSTFGGIGERAGNCSLEEIVMAVKTRYPDCQSCEAPCCRSRRR